MISTVEAVERELVDDGFVLRYRTSDDGAVDGLTGREGAFLACSFWLADCLHLIGRVDDARALFERLLALRNDLGLLSEEYDPVERRLVGNFPQAFSHVSLVNTACRLSGHDLPDGSEAERQERRGRVAQLAAPLVTLGKPSRHPWRPAANANKVKRRGARAQRITLPHPTDAPAAGSDPKAPVAPAP